MKTLKLNISLLAFISVSLFTGCSENFVSHENINPELKSGSVSEMNFEEGVYDIKIKLGPGETFYLDYSNTNLILIHSYSISNCNIDRRDLYIRSSNQADSSSLPCSWNKSGSFAFEDLSIKNVSGKTKMISVNLKGYTFNN